MSVKFEPKVEVIGTFLVIAIDCSQAALDAAPLTTNGNSRALSKSEGGWKNETVGGRKIAFMFPPVIHTFAGKYADAAPAETKVPSTVSAALQAKFGASKLVKKNGNGNGNAKRR